MPIITDINQRRYESKITREIYTEKEWKEIIRLAIEEGLTSDTTTFERMLLMGRLNEVRSDFSSDMKTGSKFI